MNSFLDTAEKVEFLKRYNLVPKTATELPVFYYFKPSQDIPIVCEIIGYENVYDTWAIIVIKAENNIINIHSDYLLEMKRKGNSFYKNSVYVVFDIETTGKSYKKDEIMEISAIKYVGSQIYEFNELIHIESIVPIDVTSLTGITNEMLYDAEPLNIVLPKFLDFIGSYKLIGHNVKAFDIHFINKACQELKLPEVKNELIDTLQIARKNLHDLANYKLSTICDFYGINNSGAHRALADCYMCNDIYERFLTEGFSVSDSKKSKNKTLKSSVIDMTKSCIFLNISSLLSNIIDELELPPNGIIIKPNNGIKRKTSSIYINEPPFPATEKDFLKENTTQSILNIEETADTVILLVSKNAFDYVSLPEDIFAEEKSDFMKICFPIDHSELYTCIKSIVQFRVKHYTSSASLFGCCDRFMECSDAKKCVHENKLYSTSCMYRMNLESGRIFYGKNRNIDH